MRPLTLDEYVDLFILSVAVSREVDAKAGELLARFAGGDETALAPLASRLEEIGRPEEAERFRRLAAE